jgi:DNA-binding transcriptional MocR family regulator
MTFRPNFIELVWGQPDPKLLAVEAMRRASETAFTRWESDMLHYGYFNGPGPLIEWLIARIKTKEGIEIGADEIMITSGNSLGLDQLLTLHTQTGDVIFVESPTYYIAIQILRDHPNLELVPVKADENGICVDVLRERIDEVRRAGKRPRMVYCVPTFNNPLGTSLSPERRSALVQLANEQHVLIVEDDVYRELNYDDASPPSLWSIAKQRGMGHCVARLGSFAKSLAPGLRLGYMNADPQMVARFADGGVIFSGGGNNHFAAMQVAAFCQNGDFDTNTARLRSAYRARRDTMINALAQHLPQCRWVKPQGGYFVWVTCPAHINTAELVPFAEKHAVSYVPGAKFYTTNPATNCMRLAFSLYEPDRLYEGVRRLGLAMKDFEQSFH